LVFLVMAYFQVGRFCPSLLKLHSTSLETW
jgi:hypothetical protein